MRKIISILLCLALVFSLSACTNQTSSNENTFNDNSDSIISDQTPNSFLLLPIEYDVIINNIIDAYPWNDDDITMVPENPELSYMYSHNSSLSEIGFALIDLDGNGQEELIISDITKPFVYDLYTILDGQAIHLFGSHERNAYYVYEKGYIENQWSGSAATSGHDFYKLNDDTLDFIERITMDAYHALDIGLIKDLSEATNDNTFFRSKSDNEDDYEATTFDEALKAIEAYQSASNPLKIEFILFSEYKK